MLALAPCTAESLWSTPARTAASVSPTIPATFSSVGASMMLVCGVASGSSIASRSCASAVCVTDRLPAVRITITRSPGSSNVNILR